MSAQTTVSRPANSSHLGILGAVTVGVGVLIAGVALAVALLQPVIGSPGADPAFNAIEFRAEERAFQLAPAFNGPAFRAEERALQLAPALVFDGPAFRAEERTLTIP